MNVKHILKNSLITMAILIAGSACILVLQQFAEADTHVPLLFVLCVLFISRLTDGYAYGIIASVLSVIGANWIWDCRIWMELRS